MSTAPSTSAPAEALLPAQPMVSSVAGDAASPHALGRMMRALVKADRGPTARQRRKALEQMKAAVAAISAGDYAASAACALSALALDGTSGLAWHILAIAKEKSGEYSQAILAYEAALKLLPEETDIASDLGRLAQRLGFLEIAKKLFIKYLARAPGNIEVTNNLACVQRDEGLYGDAVETLRNLLAIEPESALLWNTLGTVLSDQGDMAGSIVFFDEALRLEPGFFKALYNRANVRVAMGAPLEALSDIETALGQAQEPVEVDTIRMAKALTQIGIGDLVNGFETYEVRFSPWLDSAVRIVTDCPRWEPSDALVDRHILVIGEQGLGDEVLFANVLPDLVEALGPGGRMTLAVEHRLVPLFARSFPDANVIPHRTVKLEGRLTRIAEVADNATPADFWTPIGSLFRRFRLSSETFPTRLSYLRPDPARIAYWQGELASLGPAPKVGVLWKSLRMEGVRRRSFSPFELWRRVLATPGVTFVNLQYGDATADLAEAAAAGLSLWTPPGIDLKDDLDDLAALTCALDLIVGPPNATSNIAAACGAEWWALSTPHAWPRFGTDRYPAYPSTRIFPVDGFGDWEGVMDRLADTIGPWAADRAMRLRRGNAA